MAGPVPFRQPDRAEAAALKLRLLREVADAGLAEARLCRPDAATGATERLAAFLARKWHGTMGWMAERAHWRGSPAALWPEARTVIVVADLYTPDFDPMARLAARDRGVISAYALGRDYHDVLKKKLKRVARWLVAETGAEVKVFVDTAPVMEKPLGQAAGLGWQGKHTNLLSRRLGNWFFLGEIFTTLRLEPDEPEGEHCGSCRACLDICPTAAFAAPWQLDARRCISYLTIEHAGPVDEALRPRLGNRIYGCDDCLAVCPWNKFARKAREMRYAPRAELLAPPLADLARLDDAGFRQMFSGSPVKRIGRGRFVRNVLYAIGNSGDAALRAVAAGLCEDPDPVVADAARWAVTRLDAAGKGADPAAGPGADPGAGSGAGPEPDSGAAGSAEAGR